MSFQTDPSITSAIKNYVNNVLKALQANGTLSPNTSANGLIASATQTQVAGTPLGATINWAETVATTGNAFTISIPAIPGARITLINIATNTCKLFPGSGDNFNIDGSASSANASVNVPGSGNELSLYCTKINEWRNV
jgi:hypothetical protein